MDKVEVRSKLTYLQSKFMKVLNLLSPEQLQEQIQDRDNGWTAIEIMRHIATSEQAIVDLMKEVAMGGQGADSNFDLSTENEINRKRDENLDINDIRNKMEQTRSTTLDFLNTTESNTWNIEGMYFTRERMTVSRMFQILMWHQNHHVKNIIEKLNLEL